MPDFSPAFFAACGWYVAACAGWFLAWTPVVAVLEYVTHRWIMHRDNRWLDPRQHQRQAHASHHAGGNQANLVDMPVRNCLVLTAPFLLAAAAWGCWGPEAWLGWTACVGLLTWCFVYAYLWTVMHRAIHDVEPNWFARTGVVFRYFRAHHLRHHVNEQVNFGTVFPVTDVLFGTRPRRGRSRQRSDRRSR